MAAVEQSVTTKSLVAVVGNPNAGKTTLFNSLTGSHQKVANYPGVTVERVSAHLDLGDRDVELVDVPGLYSLEPVSEDEVVAVGALEGTNGPKPDLVLCVVSAAALERNLYLFSLLVERGWPVVVALTMTDIAESRGEKVDVDKLTELLGVPVVPVIGHRAIGTSRLLRELSAALDDPSRALRAPILGEPNPIGRYEWAAGVQAATLTKRDPNRPTRSDRIDAWLTNKVCGMVFFFGLMYLVFQSIYSFATPFMDLIEAGFGWLGDRVGALLGDGIGRDLVVDGLIGGVGTVLVFLPQILILFFFIAVLEGTGYLARAAFLMDKLLSWCGLNGRAFIPLLSSYACAVPGVLSARVMPDPKSRLATILVAPLMSCSARLPVYLVLIGAFIEPKLGAGWAGFTLFAMHLLGLAVAIPVVFVLNRGLIKGKRLPFLLELPPYQLPKMRDVWLAMYFRGRVFVQTAGTIILVMSVLIWALTYFPRSAESQAKYAAEFRAAHPSVEGGSKEEVHFVEERLLQNSYLGRFGQAIEPVFRPAGFDWRITTSILAAFPAREVVVPSMGILFRTGSEALDDDTDLRKAMNQATWPDGRPLLTPWTAVGLMVFFALCAQCMATLATVKRETNSWKWPVFMFVYMSTLAYLGAVLINQLGLRFG